MAADTGRMAGRLPGWWFPQSLAKYFPEGRPLAGAGFIVGLTLYLVAHVLDVLSGLGQEDVRTFFLGLTGQRVQLAVAPGLVLAILLTTSRAQPATARQSSLDDWTLTMVVIIGTVSAVFLALGFLVQLSDWAGGFLPTVYDLMIRAGAVISIVTSVAWALGRLYAARGEVAGSTATT